MEKLPKKLSFSFLPIPEEIMLSNALSFGAKVLFGIIAKTNREKIVFKIKTLAERMQCSPREAQRRVKELKDNNLLIVEEKLGKANSYSINLELVNVFQTHDHLVVGGTTKTRSSPNIYNNNIYNNKETSKDGNKVAIIRNYFIEKCKKEKGFEPEMSFAKEGRLIKEKLKRYSTKQLTDLIDKFFNSNIGENLGWSLGICFSANVINQWLAGKLEKTKKPYFRSLPMRKIYGRWQVLENGEWLEFAGKESEIEFK